MTTEEFVTYEQAVKLKELGFDWECNQYYCNKTLSCIDTQAQVNRNVNGWGRDSKFSAPTLAQAAKWLREVKGIDIDVRTNCIGKRDYDFVAYRGTKRTYSNKDFDIYETALSAGIDAALEMTK